MWAYYLNNSGRYGESIAFSRAAFTHADKADRPYLLNTWANAQFLSGHLSEAMALYRAALRLKPDFWIARSNVIEGLFDLGDEEGAWQAGEELSRAAGGRPGRAPEVYYVQFDRFTWNLSSWRNSVVTDADANSGVGTDSLSAGVQIADIDARLHDSASADLTLQTLKTDDPDPSVGAGIHFVRGLLAIDAGDTARAAAEMEAFATAYANPAVSGNYPGYDCWIGLAEDAAGHRDKADAALKGGGHFVDCYRFRADVLDRRGDWAAAQKAYAEAVALAPDLPAAYYSWGVALAKHGDLARAEAKLADANKRGPQWADPLKAWGELLAKQGKTKEALAKYDEALKYAPNWKELKDLNEALAKHAG